MYKITIAVGNAKKQILTINETMKDLTVENFENLNFAQDFSKKDAKKQGLELARTILDNGNVTHLR